MIEVMGRQPNAICKLQVFQLIWDGPIKLFLFHTVVFLIISSSIRSNVLGDRPHSFLAVEITGLGLSGFYCTNWHANCHRFVSWGWGYYESTMSYNSIMRVPCHVYHGSTMSYNSIMGVPCHVYHGSTMACNGVMGVPFNVIFLWEYLVM